MRWPWVSRLAYEAVVSERDHLRAETTRLTEAMTRISRREVGLPETPKEPRAPMTPMPKELADYIRGFAGQSIQKSMRDTAYRMAAAGRPWPEIQALTMAEEETR